MPPVGLPIVRVAVAWRAAPPPTLWLAADGGACGLGRPGAEPVPDRLAAIPQGRILFGPTVGAASQRLVERACMDGPTSEPTRLHLARLLAPLRPAVAVHSLRWRG